MFYTTVMDSDFTMFQLTSFISVILQKESASDRNYISIMNWPGLELRSMTFPMLAAAARHNSLSVFLSQGYIPEILQLTILQSNVVG